MGLTTPPGSPGIEALMIYDPNAMLTADAPTRYLQNGFDVTWYVLNNLPLPISERFFPVIEVALCKQS